MSEQSKLHGTSLHIVASVKRSVKLSLCLTKHHAMKAYGRVEV